MSRWMIEKDGTGIERSGTGVEKSGTGVEKSGTGIGLPETGNTHAGARATIFACALVAAAFSGSAHSDGINPLGSLQLVVERNTLAASWIVDGNIFAGISAVSGSYVNLALTEVALSGLDLTELGNSKAQNKVEISGNGTGSSSSVSGGSAIQVTGNGTGSATQISGNGTGGNPVSITLPEETGLAMEVVLGCGTASVTVLDSSYVPIVAFSDVPVIGDSGFCMGSGNGGFSKLPGGTMLSP